MTPGSLGKSTHGFSSFISKLLLLVHRELESNGTSRRKMMAKPIRCNNKTAISSRMLTFIHVGPVYCNASMSDFAAFSRSRHAVWSTHNHMLQQSGTIDRFTNSQNIANRIFCPRGSMPRFTLN